MAKATALRILNSPFGLQLFSLAFLVLFITSFRPSYFWGSESFDSFSLTASHPYFEIVEPGFLENTVGVNTAGLERILVKNEETGEMGEKIIPKKRDKEINYIVKSGDRIENIAHRFGLKVSTILWANELTVKSVIEPDDKLRIPPTDGVYYKIKKGETLSEIAKLHDIELVKVQAYNQLRNKVKVGQEIFLPEAQKIFVQVKPEVIPKKTITRVSGNKYTAPYPRSGKSGGGSIASVGLKLLRPTKGVITQGFHKGHYALDIASAKNTPIYAAAAGTVVREAHTGWNYGYGRYIVIDHGNGVETLYAHNNVTKVGVGDVVKKGQLISLMGNTGNVFGRTGIHLHFEVRIRGRKVNPNNYF